MAEADERFMLSQRERITLGILTQSDDLRAGELAERLDTPVDALATWVGRLIDLGLVQTSGRTKGTRYFVSPDVLRGAGLTGITSLKRIEEHRLEELIREDLKRYPKSRIGEIQSRIGPEIPRSRLKRTLAQLVDADIVAMEGRLGGARYRLRSQK
jgi:ATP-dependent DNA helicase RecG